MKDGRRIPWVIHVTSTQERVRSCLNAQSSRAKSLKVWKREEVICSSVIPENEERRRGKRGGIGKHGRSLFGNSTVLPASVLDSTGSQPDFDVTKCTSNASLHRFGRRLPKSVGNRTSTQSGEYPPPSPPVCPIRVKRSTYSAKCGEVRRAWAKLRRPKVSCRRTHWNIRRCARAVHTVATREHA